MLVKTYRLDNFSPIHLYQYLKLRADVFVVEQNCVYPDIDDLDLEAEHLLLFQDEQLIACARIFKPAKNGSAIIGRVASHIKFRKKGFGHELMKAAHKYILQQYHTTSVEISAQCYLIKFYQSHGYQTIGMQYLEDGIPHIKMQRKD